MNVSKILITFSVSMCVGCAMCDSSMDCNYHAYGGMRDRVDRVNGRVGSIFDPAVALESVLPVEDPLPVLGGATDESDSGGSHTGAELTTEELLEGLREFGELPKVPTVEDESEVPAPVPDPFDDDDPQNDILNFDEI